MMLSSKFRTDGKEAGNGEYATYCVDKCFLAQVAIQDVRDLHRCRTRAMFETMAKLVILAWKAVGEEKLASVFSKSYLDDDTLKQVELHLLRQCGSRPAEQQY
jgi:hypothetical protein